MRSLAARGWPWQTNCSFLSVVSVGRRSTRPHYPRNRRTSTECSTLSQHHTTTVSDGSLPLGGIHGLLQTPPQHQGR